MCFGNMCLQDSAGKLESIARSLGYDAALIKEFISTLEIAMLRKDVTCDNLTDDNL